MVAEEKNNSIFSQTLFFEPLEDLRDSLVQVLRRLEIEREILPNHRVVGIVRRQLDRRRINRAVRKFYECPVCLREVDLCVKGLLFAAVGPVGPIERRFIEVEVEVRLASASDRGVLEVRRVVAGFAEQRGERAHSRGQFVAVDAMAAVMVERQSKFGTYRSSARNGQSSRSAPSRKHSCSARLRKLAGQCSASLRQGSRSS